MIGPRASAAVMVLVGLLVPVTAHGESIRNPLAVFAGLDKVTGKIKSFQVPIDKEGRFGSLLIRPRVCYSRPVTEEPKTTSFVEVDEQQQSAAKRIFSGWMLAESPGLNAVEHPVYDVWLTGCRDPNAPKPLQEAPPPPIDLEQADVPKDND
jgi:hypothetical protein